MIDHIELNALLEKLQAETPNCGGFYHFSEVQLPAGETLLSRLKEHLHGIKAYREPYVDDPGNNRTHYIADRDPENLSLKTIGDVRSRVAQKLDYWSRHRTSLDERETFTADYPALADEFQLRLHEFLATPGLLNTYEVNGIDTFYTFGGDHLNDDTLFETAKGIYVLHFGWSS